MLNTKAIMGISCAALLGASVPVQAANWLMLQGTEEPGTSKRAHLWGFIQAQYQKDYSDPNPAGQYIPPKLIGPDLNTQSAFNVNRARVGVRGTALPLDSNVDYFLLLELGNNAITEASSGFAKVSDASVTLNHIPGARVRMGLFKYPGAEEGLQAIHVFDYINFTWVSNQLLLERIPNDTYTPNVPAQTIPPAQDFQAFNSSVGAFRDTGIQIFDTFAAGGWDHTYALMIGNGNGLNFSDNNSSKDTYLYWSSEKPFEGGQKARKEGLKFFAWTQRGTRTLDNTDDGEHNPVEYDRDRSGLGFKYFKKPFRMTAEYMTGEGMIFVGPDKPTFDQNGVAANQPAADGTKGKANGWYVDFGWYIPKTKWQLDMRYDVYNRLTNDPGPPRGPAAGRSFEAQFKSLTLGAQYHVNKKTRVAVNYEIRDVESPDWPTGAGPNANMDGIGNRLGLQVTTIF